jgi:GNAT superfamily N-acetyltransferase
MIVTKFLSIDQYSKFADWLCNQDTETQQCYFGTAASDHLITTLIERILSNPDNHYFLVALDHNQWVGTVHIAINNSVVEFGIIVDKNYRRQGIADLLLEEAILWSRNRGFKELYMQCLGWNTAIKHLCHYHGLETVTESGDSKIEMSLPPSNWITVSKEIGINQRNLFRMWLNNTWYNYQEIYG